MTLKIQRICFTTLAIFQISAMAPKSLLPHGTSASNNSVGNTIQSFFSHCLTHLVQYPTGTPLDFDTLRLPITWYHVGLDQQPKSKCSLLNHHFMRTAIALMPYKIFAAFLSCFPHLKDQFIDWISTRITGTFLLLSARFCLTVRNVFVV